MGDSQHAAPVQPSRVGALRDLWGMRKISDRASSAGGSLLCKRSPHLTGATGLELALLDFWKLRERCDGPLLAWAILGCKGAKSLWKVSIAFKGRFTIFHSLAAQLGFDRV